MSDEEQAVADQSNEPPKEVSEEEGAQDLDSLLAEFEQEDEPSEPEKTSLNKEDLEEVVSYIKSEKETRLREQASKDLEATVKNVKGDLKVPDELVKGLLHVKASDNPQMLKAYQNRGKNPAAWAKVEKNLNRELKKLLEGLGDKSEENKKRVADAVRNAKSESPDVAPESFGKLSNSEFSALKQKLFKQAG